MGKNSIAQYIKVLANNKNSLVSVEVKDVSFPTFTGILPTGEELLNIRLVSEEDDTNFIQIPVIGSNVLVCYVDNQNAIGLVYGELEEIFIRGSQYDGLVKVNDLVSKLNNIEIDLNTLKTAFASWVVVASDGGAALKATTATWYGSSITPTIKSDLENNKVKHG
jgi:hypothetical protein